MRRRSFLGLLVGAAAAERAASLDRPSGTVMLFHAPFSHPFRGNLSQLYAEIAIERPLTFPTIKEALDHAESGDAIVVWPGTYTAEAVTLDAGRTLIGLNEGRPRFDV